MFKIIENMSFDVKKKCVTFVDACLLFYCFVGTSVFFNFVVDYIGYTYSALFSLLNVILLSFTGSYEVVWSLFGFRDGVRIAVSLVLTSTAFYMFGGFEPGLVAGVFLVFLSFNVLIFSRLIYANWRTLVSRSSSKSEKILIIGAGEAGAQLFKSLKKDAMLGLNPVGFLDDHPRKRTFKIHGAKVYGTVNDLSRVASQLAVQKVIVAIPSASNEEMQRIFNVTNSAGLELRTIPSLKNILNGKVDPSQIKKLEPEDLLGRDSVILDQSALGEILTYKTVLVTGAGGSIGSELCNQISNFSPATLVLFEQSELFLYELEMKLSKKYSNINIIPVIGDVRCYTDIDSAITTFKPDVVFHAAAYKHVPLMESNPVQAIRTNVLGTQNVAKAAGSFKVPRFVLISTDKAVNPTNVMGATKRVAEIACQIESTLSVETKFMVVRFGNVLGSSGSVIPLFTRQILAGGPVTVTHRDIIRYFMSIPEACQLVLQASVLGEGGEIFVLDMGDPVKITHLAEEMIRLSGLKVGIDISIEYTGLRPGEKLYEELLADGETTNPTSHSKILIAKNREFNPTSLENLNQLLSVVPGAELAEIVAKLKLLVPELTHNIVDVG
jgi:FlaA1/EpsC-like NDP-sugar epimerase